MAAPSRWGPGLDRGPALLRTSPARIAHNGPSLTGWGFLLSASIGSPAARPRGLGCIVLLALLLLLPVDRREHRENSHYCEPFSIRSQMLSTLDCELRIHARMGSSNPEDWAIGAGVSPFTSDAIFRPGFSMEGLHVFRNTFVGLLQLLGRVHLLCRR